MSQEASNNRLYQFPSPLLVWLFLVVGILAATVLVVRYVSENYVQEPIVLTTQQMASATDKSTTTKNYSGSISLAECVSQPAGSGSFSLQCPSLSPRVAGEVIAENALVESDGGGFWESVWRVLVEAFR